MDVCVVFCFSIRRRHTRWPRDWSSDVCSSDLTTVLDQLGARLATRTRPELLEGLTAREREVLERVGRGESNDEIGSSLFISPATARTDVSRLLAKLQARQRAGLVLLAYRSGQGTPAGPGS